MTGTVTMGVDVNARTESPHDVARRTLDSVLPGVEDRIARLTSLGETPGDGVAEAWLVVWAADVRDRLSTGRVPDVEVDAIIDVSARVMAVVEDVLDVDVVVECAQHLVTARASELAAPARPETRAAAPAATPIRDAAARWWNSKRAAFTAPRPQRPRTVVTCADVTDRRGNVIVPEGVVGTALDWSMFGPVRVVVHDRNGRPFEVRVMRSDLAEVDG